VTFTVLVPGASSVAAPGDCDFSSGIKSFIIFGGVEVPRFHPQRLKPQFSKGSYGTAKAVP
jgi:hypothetical protein